MKTVHRIIKDWRLVMNNADRARVAIALTFPRGAILHIGWVFWHRDLMYHGTAPSWAVWFWYSLFVMDFIVCWVLLKHPKTGTILAVSTMTTTSFVNLTFFLRLNFTSITCCLAYCCLLCLSGQHRLGSGKDPNGR